VNPEVELTLLTTSLEELKKVIFAVVLEEAPRTKVDPFATKRFFVFANVPRISVCP
jgi:hypothetical protein